ncbi:Amino-acid carrier protein AlsT [bioreactor metagenome]|uniref:Sodium/alanine symporter AgcS n=2 Tax=root TaxID=1 RepID=A0A098B8E7_DESHA|nr:alanine/glycine:cation symporter family protein [Desulfitobacterium hafniense]MEA5022833.1 alanine/glycine:cation symporter family protein [Desulfitobacterium hafniense]CDX05143.1 Sodium/alanine symporter AgcS [Desulfitobacterium hafniense]
MDALHNFIVWLNDYLWGPPMLALLFGTHLFLTFRTRGIQRHIFKGIKLSLTKDPDASGDVSQFGALTTALAATIGTGNIVGVATAVALGGPGAVLWCWLTGVFGIATKYGEALLAVKYRVKTADGTMLGGPMYALERGLGQKWLAVLFCIFTSIAAFGIGNMTQANSISGMLNSQFNVNPIITGLLLASLTGIVIIGGVKWIARVCEKFVPFMAIAYVLGCIIILIINASYVWPAVVLICESAFTPTAAGGGFVGASIIMAARYGIARGLFSNESGLGSAPIVAAAAQTRNPVRQALVSATGTFWDTVVVCLMTGLVVVSSVLRSPTAAEGLKGGDLTAMAFNQIPVIGPIVLTFGLLTFVFSTILGWSYYGERAVEYLFGKKGILPYRLLWVLAVLTGSLVTLQFVWDLSDAMNAMMAIPNLVALLLLSGVIVSETRKYLWEDRLDEASDEPIPVIQNK